MKKKLSFLLLAAILISCFHGVFAKEGNPGETLIPRSYYLPVGEIASPMEQVMIQICATGLVNGKDYYYACSIGGMFTAYNLDEKKVVGEHKIKASTTWSMKVDSTGMVYVEGVVLYKYDPYQNKMYNLGGLPPNCGEMLSMDIDDQDNLYIGTRGNGSMVKYDSKTGEMKVYGQPVPGAVSNVGVYHKGYLYSGVYGTHEGKVVKTLVKMNANDPFDKKVFDLTGVIQGDKITYMSIAGDYVFFATNSDKLLAVDASKEDIEIVDFGSEDLFHSTVVPSLDDKNIAYYNASGYMYEVNLEKRTSVKIMNCINQPIRNYGTQWVTIENDPDLPGHSIFMSRSGVPCFFNIQTKKWKVWEDVTIKGAPGIVSSAGRGPEDTVYFGGFRIADVAIYHTKKHDLQMIKTISQTDSFVEYKGLMYSASYPGGHLYVHDLKKTYEQNVNPRKLGEVGPTSGESDRVHVMIAAEDKIFMGHIPGYGKLGGSFAWYDLKTNEIVQFHNLIHNQSIINLVYKDGLIYGATSIGGGSYSNPTEKAAKIFIFDVEKRKLIKEFTPLVEGVPTPKSINGLTFDKNGKLWCTVYNNLFSVDPETEAVSNLLTFPMIGYAPETSVSGREPVPMLFDKNGLMYACIDRMRVIDLENMTYYTLRQIPKNTFQYAFGSDNNLYFASNTSIYVLPVLDHEVDEKMLFNTAKEFENKIGLIIGNPIAYTNGEAGLIDAGNEEVVPVVESGRTLVPLRYIGESLGAKVQWEENTNTAKLTKKGLEVSITVDGREMMVNNKEFPLDVPAKLMNGRTMIPLRAVSDAFSKKVYWNEKGIIIISDEEISYEENQKELIDYFLRFYAKNEYKVTKYFEDRQANIREMRGKIVPLKNGDFEMKFFTSNPIPRYFQVLYTGAESFVSLSTDFARDGKQSLKIENQKVIGSTYHIGVETDFIQIHSNMTYYLFDSVYSKYGTVINHNIAFYDEAKNLLGVVNNGTGNLAECQWNNLETSIPVKYLNAKYMKIRILIPGYSIGDLYVDSLLLIEY